MFNASDDSSSETDVQTVNRNIGLYTKTGYCYSDIKSFLPQVVSLILVAIWFSDNKQSHNISDLEQKKRVKEERQHLISDIGYLSLRLKLTLQPKFIQQYKDIAAFLKTQDNLFILSKGTASFIAEYAAMKFSQITSIHAEAYGSAEFRHGPLAMINEDENTACKYISIVSNFYLWFSHFLGPG